MVFSVKNVIELSGGKKYIVADTLEINNIWYYYLYEIDSEEKIIKDVKRIITTVSENNNILVKSINGTLATEIETKFKERQNI